MVKTSSGRFYHSFSWAKFHKFYSLLILIVLLAAGIFVYEKVALELNKRAFAQARATIDAVYADIVAQVGPPDNFKHENFCSRPNVEFGQGPLSCDVGAAFIYGVSNIDQANDVLKKIQTVITSSNTFKFAKPLSESITSTPVVNTIYTSATDYYKTAGLECIVSYWYDTPRQTELSISDKNKKPLEISLSCNDWARAQYYPNNN